ncbi:hypothetical protein TOREUM_30537 [Tenacibaculum litoreum]|uniref:hypothetical protein n=1 Tax=Tenacibaculum litoreum TaxID=321269 RepID=UPI003895EDF8
MFTSYRFQQFLIIDRLYPTGLDNDLDSMKTFLKSIEKGTLEMIKSDVQKMEVEMKNDVIIDNEIIFSNVDFLDYKSTSSALNIIYNSTLVSLYSFLETRLKFLYELLENQKNIRINKNKGESNIMFYKRKLEEKYFLDFSSLNAEWEEICLHTLLRNTLTHSHIQEQKTDISDYKKIQSIEHLSTEMNSGILLFEINDFKFLYNFFDKISEILNFICYIKTNAKINDN